MFSSKKETKQLPTNVQNIDTLFGSSCVVNGDIATKGTIKIDGTVNGNVSSDVVIIIAQNGKIKGDVKCKELIVYGSIEGTINTEKLNLESTSHIKGEINTQSLQVESGAVYQGAVNMKSHVATTTATSTTQKSVPPAKQDNKIKL